ncbi:Na+/H+ antiporter subunit A [Solicola gregarius]|uniref:Na+/H+ antiporter subunit A n=1 Tax=Solicola gregarius TaxID=2908642 RepID=A0AA46TDZ8_9ACTN|nr:Na+/H+ antiporter subunit A [Solicola gregarius]UYM03577.1 Na+/H+ antiporter subunit A [Solicola gregarius]
MIAVLLTLHLVAAVGAPTLVHLLDRRAFYVLAAVPAIAFGWVVSQAATVVGSSGDTYDERHDWIVSLGFDLDFRLDALSWVMALLVSGVGALVLVYCGSYFRADDPHLWRFTAVFTAFAGSMLGLVLADNLLLMYVFWELTTVFSYLLVGHNPERKANRRAAMTALIVTTFGGLAMLVGIILIGESTGSYRLTTLLAEPPDGTLVTVSVGLLLVGAITKSALVPFHFWLPGAMAAPTPVSAYLHAAAMVKAGIYLVAAMAPAFAASAVWREPLLALGVFTMVLGGLRALRQYDVKLLLAYGTVSQLGFLMVVVGVGTRAAALAGVAMIVAHALFKAALFLVVGIVDRCTGTRDLRELTGMRHRMPVLFWTTLLAAASMAGIPPLAGFVAKESVYAAFLDVIDGGDGTGIETWFSLAILAGMFLGSLLTAAYSARFVWGVFGDKADAAEPDHERRPLPLFVLAPVVLGVGSLALGFLGRPETDALLPYAEQFPAGAHEPYLSLWHGWTLALGLSAIAITGGIVLFWQRRRIAALRWTWPSTLDAERAYRAVMRAIDRLAVEVTGRTQSGSLPVYLSVILLAVVILPGAALAMNGEWPTEYHVWDTPVQAAVAAIMAAAAVLTVRSRRRLRAVILVSVVGYGTALLFILHGAPDLALTQILVETVTLVVFVLVMRRLPAYFSSRPLSKSRWWRIALGVVVGVVAAGMAYVASGSRTATPISERFAKEAVEYGGGKNIVNVTLVDIRAWDTMGELTVLVVAATGVASLIFLITGRSGRVQRLPHRDESSDVPTRPTGRWLAAGPTLRADRRSLVFEVITRLIFHTIIVFSIYLVFSGHNLPGGGFAGGLVAGIALMVRYLAGGRHELDNAAPIDAGVVLGLGLTTSMVAAMAPLLFGGDVLQSAVIDLHPPLLGDIHLVTSLFFDVGVYLVVIGLMLDVLRSLGGGIDRQGEESEPAEPAEIGSDA